MGRLLIHVPRLYTEDEFLKVATKVPPDYDEKAEEFWGYIDEKLSVLGQHVKRIYLESLEKIDDEVQDKVHSILGVKGTLIINKLLSIGAKLQPTEDPKLILETDSWTKMMQNNPELDIVGEMFEDNIRERDSHIAWAIDQTLAEGETGVIFLEPVHKLSLRSDVRLV
ncbi:MAG: hypothetical protein ACE5KO_07190, partial [Candidatus Bathyarchaeia archaeon]